MSGFLELYEPLEVIGNGSFGLIRKVKRKSDGLVFARKELNFERMSERDRKQIVAEVNILKDLHHDHIVRYHDRYVDRDAGILYILMEYCSGGDLSSIIKQAQKSGRFIPEDTIWNYFLQILLALQHCHHPNGHGHTRSGSSGLELEGGGGRERRSQILHRDLKPDNVFLSDNQVKLGDFGLAKALVQANFANTYVGTPYYMSPELMQEKAYDSKSDIWSLGCLIYELCALKPPFHEAKTHNELSIFIRNGRIPPLPKGYSQSLSSVIKAMLNLNPAMRPSSAQLLQHERLELVMKVSETEKMLNTVKSHKATVSAKERELMNREQELLSRESAILAALAEKDNEINHLKYLLSQHDQLVRESVSRREEELRVLVMQREEEVSAASNKREAEIMQAVREREEMLCEALKRNEASIREREEALQKRTDDLKEEEEKIVQAKAEIEAKVKLWEAKEKESTAPKGRRDKGPLEEVKNLLARMTTEESPANAHLQVASSSRQRIPAHLQTPLARNTVNTVVGSAMRGVVLTSTGETLCTPAPANLLATPTPADLVSLFDKSPKVGLDFSKIFEKPTNPFPGLDDSDDDSDHSPPPSPSKKERPRSKSSSSSNAESSSSSGNSTPTNSTSKEATLPSKSTRIRRPSIRSSQSSSSKPPALTRAVSQQEALVQPLSHPHLQTQRSASTSNIVLPPPPTYDLNDEENLPSPFLKRTATVDMGVQPPRKSTKTVTRRKSNANSLRAVAALNSAKKPAESGAESRPATTGRKGGEELRKALNKS